MAQDLLRSLVWLDYRLALLVLVLLPLILLIWALVARAEAMQRLLIIYWRVSSLLMISLYLLIGRFPIGFAAGLLAGVLIPAGLWFWLDLNEEIGDLRPSALKLTLTSWRWAASAYCVLSLLASLPFVSCGFSRTSFNTPFCQVWTEVPLLYKDFFHANSTPGFLGFLGIVGLVIYVLYLLYFVMVRLGKQGRIAIEQ